MSNTCFLTQEGHIPTPFFTSPLAGQETTKKHDNRLRKYCAKGRNEIKMIKNIV